MKKITPSKVLVFIALCLMTVTFIYPMFYMFVNGAKTIEGYAKDPFAIIMPGSSFSNYVMLISRFKLQNNFFNTIFITVVSILLILSFCVCASYAFAKVQFRFKTALYIAIIGTMLIPSQVTMIPLYVIFASWGLINNPWSVILSYLAGGIPGCVFLLTANFRGVPKEMLEAAEIDGCGYFRTVSMVVARIGSAAIFIYVVFSFIGFWNDLFTPMILIPKDSVRTIMVALAAVVGRYGDPPYQLAGLTLATLPAIAVYIVFSRFIVKGVTMGSFK